MKFCHYVSRLKKLDQLIRNENTGPPDLLAEQMEFSKSSLHIHIQILKELGAEIRYVERRQTYVYVTRKAFVIGFVDEQTISVF